jgi:NAD(P)-dependent dehydrogenase (short-subunit alcohol dehydrogenase family)
MSSILITGANRGLGLEFARQYAADGWDVIATARNPKSSEELQQLAKNKNVSLHGLDVTSDESVKQLAETPRQAHRFARPELGYLYAKRNHTWRT